MVRKQSLRSESETLVNKDVKEDKNEEKESPLAKHDEFIKISKESEEIIQKKETTFEESQTVTKTKVIKDVKIEKKEKPLTLPSTTKADSFKEIEKESKEIVVQLEKSYVSSMDAEEIETEDEGLVIIPGFLKSIKSKASELVNKSIIGKSVSSSDENSNIVLEVYDDEAAKYLTEAGNSKLFTTQINDHTCHDTKFEGRKCFVKFKTAKLLNDGYGIEAI